MEIKLDKNKSVVIDKEDYSLISKYQWYARPYSKTFYAYTHPKKKENPIAMHRLILNINKREIIIDHIDRNGLNNRKENLRLCSHSQNKINSNLFKNNTSGFSGIVWDKSRNKWASRIRYKNKLINLGRFEDIEDAIKIRNLKGKELFGEFYTHINIKEDKLKWNTKMN